MGVPIFDSTNGETMEAPGDASIAELRIRDGKRESVFNSYVRPLPSRRNLMVITDALVTRLIFDGKRARGVEVLIDGRRRQFLGHCETLLSHEAMNTPKVLMQSGIGPEDGLKWYSGCPTSAGASAAITRITSPLAAHGPIESQKQLVVALTRLKGLHHP